MQIEDTNSALPIQHVKDIVTDADAATAAAAVATKWLANEYA